MERKKMIIVGGIGAGLLSLGVAGYAIAQEMHDPMAMFDADGNGQITLSESQQAAATMFARVDANGDGRATFDEIRAHHRGGHGGPGGHGRHGGGAREGNAPPPEGRGPPPPEALDLDHDGAVTLAEFQEHLRQHLVSMDADHNGSVSREELEAGHRRHGRP
jgi:hypothetical protein